MKRSIFLLVVSALLNTQVFAETKCFVVNEKGSFFKEEGNCTKRHSPCSTFKIPLSLMGYNEGILIDERFPEWPYSSEYQNAHRVILEVWKQPHNPESWIKNSCIWYSQVLTSELGYDRFKKYVSKFHYGNQDISGDKGKNNGLTNSWLSSSLKISGLEQVSFLYHFLDNKLPVTKEAQEHTRRLLYVEDLSNGWKLYGKTGTGYQNKADGSLNDERQVGWFVGWIEKNDRKIVFSHYIEDDAVYDSPAGKRAKEGAKEKLLRLI